MTGDKMREPRTHHPGFFRLVILGKRTDESSRLLVLNSQLCLQFLISPQPYRLWYLSHEQRSDDDSQYQSHRFPPS